MWRIFIGTDRKWFPVISSTSLEVLERVKPPWRKKRLRRFPQSSAPRPSSCPGPVHCGAQLPSVPTRRSGAHVQESRPSLTARYGHQNQPHVPIFTCPRVSFWFCSECELNSSTGWVFHIFYRPNFLKTRIKRVRVSSLTQTLVVFRSTSLNFPEWDQSSSLYLIFNKEGRPRHFLPTKRLH